MRKGIVIVGVVLIVLGLVAIALPLVTSSQSYALPAYPNPGLAYSPTNLVASGTLTLSWSGAAAGTRVEVFSCTSASCAATTSTTPLASGSGESGSFSVGVSPGTYYLINQTGGTAFLITAQTSGIAYAEVVGIALVVVGAVLAIVGYRAAARPRPMAAAPPPDEDVMAPIAEAPAPAPVPLASAPAPAPEPTSEDEVRAQYVLPASAAQMTPESVQVVIPSRPSSSDTPPPTAPGQRPPIRCASCGTWNEPWLDSCRWCKRALTSTGR